jgi:hypothetical protein
MNINKAGKRMRQNWFDRELQNNGGNAATLISAMDTMKMYNDAPRIFKDLMYRNIDMQTYGHYFLDNTFIEQLYLRAYNNWRLYAAISNAMRISIEILLKDSKLNEPEIQYQEGVRNTYTRLANAYNLILKKVAMTRESKDLSFINCIANDIEQYRNEIQSEENDSLWPIFNQIKPQQYIQPVMPQNNMMQNTGMPMQNNIVQPQQQNINQYGQQQCYPYQQPQQMQPQQMQPIQNGYTFKVPIAQPQPQQNNQQSYFPNMFQNNNFK